MVVVAFDQVDPSNLLATMAGRDEPAPMVRQIGDGRVRAARNNIEARLRHRIFHSCWPPGAAHRGGFRYVPPMRQAPVLST